jgi:hypothetical protein
MQFGLFDRTYDCLVEVSANQGDLMTPVARYNGHCRTHHSCAKDDDLSHLIFLSAWLHSSLCRAPYPQRFIWPLSVNQIDRN